MKVLEEEYGLIKKKRPIRANNTSKTVRYEINDIFLRFWFRYFYKYRSLIEIKNYSALSELIKNEYSTYSGKIVPAKDDGIATVRGNRCLVASPQR